MLSETTCRHCGEPAFLLTQRQTEIAEALVARPGASNLEIACTLSMSVNTLRSHLRELYRTLGIGSRSEFLVYCLKEGIVTREERCR